MVGINRNGNKSTLDSGFKDAGRSSVMTSQGEGYEWKATFLKLAAGSVTISSFARGHGSQAAVAHAQATSTKFALTSWSSWVMIWAYGTSLAITAVLMAIKTEPRQARQGGHAVHGLLRRASCTAGRANFITGELPIRRTTVGRRTPTGLPAEAVTIATVLKSMGYSTGQFGKNHLSDRNRLPTVHKVRRIFWLSLSPRCDGRPGASQLSADLRRCRRSAE